MRGAMRSAKRGKSQSHRGSWQRTPSCIHVFLFCLGEHYESVQREYLEHEVRIKERREEREREESRRRDRERERQRQERHRRGHYSPPPPVRGQYGGRDAHAKRDNDLRELR